MPTSPPPSSTPQHEATCHVGVFGLLDGLGDGLGIWNNNTNALSIEPITDSSWSSAKVNNEVRELEFPEIGTEFYGFHLIDELGRGGFARVYLAKQHTLADRLVALKVSRDPSLEADNLARLQHTNIMPIYSVHELGGFVAVCMPYFGRSTLADMCTTLDSLATPPVSGRHVVDAITTRNQHSDSKPPQPATSSSEPLLVRPRFEQPVLNLLREMNYVDAVLWIARQIATGLAHAHDRGLIHRDLKPANILLTDDGQPMILDFNLAVNVHDEHVRGAGTLPYMSPEQLLHFGRSQSVVDVRSDIYSLGIILAQLITGRYPFVLRDSSPQGISQMLVDRTRSLPSLCGANGDVSPTVEAMIHKCLAENPAERYQSIHQFIEDLDRHRAHLPTIYAPNPSLRECVAKWARRNPTLTSPTALVAFSAAMILIVLSIVGYAHFAIQRNALQRNAERGRELVATFNQLHEQAQQTLTRETNPSPRTTHARQAGLDALALLTEHYGAEWMNRREFQHLPTDDKNRLRDRAAELVYLVGQSSVDENLLISLRNAAAVFDRQPILDATQLQRTGRFRDSIPNLKAYLSRQPDEAGAWLLLARAQAETTDFEEAYQSYNTAVALRPRSAVAYFYRAQLADQLRKRDTATNTPQALLDAERALELNPDFHEARLLKAQILFALKRDREALSELTTILESADAPNRAWLLRSRVRARMGDAAGARDDRRVGLQHEPQLALDYVARGVVRQTEDTDAAMQDFRKAEELDPLCVQAIHNQAYLQAELLNQPAAAAATLARLLKKSPNSPLLFVSRAVYLARAGQYDDAIADAERASVLSGTPSVHYRVGCVYALAAKDRPNLVPQAIKYLTRAIRGGYGWDYLGRDSDLDPLKHDTTFRRLREGVKWMMELTSEQ